MSHSFGADLRSRVILAISEGLSTRKAAARFGIGVATSGEWYRRYRDHGETVARNPVYVYAVGVDNEIFREYSCRQHVGLNAAVCVRLSGEFAVCAEGVRGILQTNKPDGRRN